MRRVGLQSAVRLGLLGFGPWLRRVGWAVRGLTGPGGQRQQDHHHDQEHNTTTTRPPPHDQDDDDIQLYVAGSPSRLAQLRPPRVRTRKGRVQLVWTVSK